MYFYPWLTIFLLGLVSAENFTINSLKTIISIGKEESSLTTNVDLLRKGLLNQQWEEDTRPCLNAILHAMENAKNFTTWAVWLIDGFPYPSGQLYGSQYHLGNFDQCVKAPWIKTHNELRTQYCLAEITVNGYDKRRTSPIDPYKSAEILFKTRTKFDRNVTSIMWGACVPAVCNEKAFYKITKVMLLQSHLNYLIKDLRISVDSCQLSGASPEYSSGFYAFVITIVLLIIITIACTVYIHYANKNNESSFNTDLAKCFCLKRNTDELTIIRKDEITSMNIMRVGSTFCVNIYHIISAQYLAPVIDGLNLDYLTEEHGTTMFHMDVIVDTYMTLSAILLMKKMMTDKTFKPLKLIWNRYIRLFGVLGAIVFFMAYVFKYTADGPAWAKLTRVESEYCAEYGWINFLMLNNHIQQDKSCFTASWFLATDFQLMVFSVILFFLWKKNEVFGFIIAVLATIFAIIAPGMVTYYKKLGPAYMEIGSLIELRHNLVFNYVYTPSYTRAGPYIVGMIVGYIFAVYKPANYRNVISIKLSILGTIFSFFLCGAVFYYGYHAVEFEQLAIAIFVASNRIIWSIAISAIIIFHEYGTLPIIDSLFKWFPLVPLSRLTFGVYMSHVVLVFILLFGTKTPHTSGVFHVVLVTIGITTMAYIISYVMWLTIEAPIININNLLFGSKKNKTVEANNTNGLIKENEKKRI